jgi:hypothetical protein
VAGTPRSSARRPALTSRLRRAARAGGRGMAFSPLPAPYVRIYTLNNLMAKQQSLDDSRTHKGVILSKFVILLSEFSEPTDSKPIRVHRFAEQII